MKTEATSFYSEGLKLDATFYLPDQGSEDPSRPIIVVCSGFMGLNSIHPARFARALTPLGYTTFGFDYPAYLATRPEKNTIGEPEIWDSATQALREGAERARKRRSPRD